MVCPIVNKAPGDTELAPLEMYVPPGKWLNPQTGEVLNGSDYAKLNGGSLLKRNFMLEDLPTLRQLGSIIATRGGEYREKLRRGGVGKVVGNGGVEGIPARSHREIRAMSPFEDVIWEFVMPDCSAEKCDQGSSVGKGAVAESY
jgi:hypothetical protein